MITDLFPGDPTVVGPYKLLKRLGQGGMGVVFLARSPGGRQVAVKVIRPEYANEPGFRTRFAREVGSARNVSGMFTALVVDADTNGQVPWLATAYVPGHSLAEAVETQGPLPPASVLQLAAGLAEGLQAIHAAGVVHRDLKPSNVLLAADGPRVIDFGISKAREASMLTQTGMVMGSPGFLSPEQAEGSEVGPPTDIFSLGGVLTYAVTGSGPFGSGPTPALMYRVVNREPDLSQVPDTIRPLIERCLAKDPAARPTPEEMLAELDELGAGVGVVTPEWLPESITSSIARYVATAMTPATPAASVAVPPPADTRAEPAEPPELESDPLPLTPVPVEVPAAVAEASAPQASAVTASAVTAEPDSAAELTRVPADRDASDLTFIAPAAAAGAAGAAAAGLLESGGPATVGLGALQPVPGNPAVGPPDVAPRPRPRRRMVLTIAAALVLIVGAALGFGLSGGGPGRTNGAVGTTPLVDVTSSSGSPSATASPSASRTPARRPTHRPATKPKKKPSKPAARHTAAAAAAAGSSASAQPGYTPAPTYSAAGPAPTTAPPVTHSPTPRPTPKPTPTKAPSGQTASSASATNYGCSPASSATGGSAVTFTFINDSSSSVSLSEYTTSGGQIGKGSIPAGGSSSFGTYTGYFWLVEGAVSGCLGAWDIEAGGSLTVSST